MKIPDLAGLAVYSGAKEYESLKTVVADFESGTKAFWSAGIGAMLPKLSPKIMERYRG